MIEPSCEQSNEVIHVQGEVTHLSGEFSLIVAVVLVLGLVWVWIWINVLLFRKWRAHSKGKHTSPSDALSSTSSASMGEEPSEADFEARFEADSEGGEGLIGECAVSFWINESTSAFEDEAWRTCFYRLTEVRDVLGWVAFSGEIVGAAAREYDNPFVDVLRSYQQTVEKLRKEVGLTHIFETSIVAEEGKIWFFSAVDHAWIALFADHDADVHELASLMQFVRVQLAHHA